MQTAKGTTRHEKRASRTRAQWEAEVKRWRASGQRREQYAQAHDLHPGTLSCWASRLRLESGGPKAGERSRVSRFAPVRVVDGTESKQTTAPKHGGKFEVVLNNGRAVRVMGPFQPDALLELLAIVEGHGSC